LGIPHQSQSAKVVLGAVDTLKCSANNQENLSYVI
jgi:hypothetical protein